jgi:hypothetical protein
MARIIEYDTVRVVALRGSAESHLAYSESLRSPVIGDLGTVVHLTPTWNPDDPSTRFIVESTDGGAGCVWLAEFAADELEFVHRSTLTGQAYVRPTE